MPNKLDRLEQKKLDLIEKLGPDPPPIMGVQVKRTVRIRRGTVLEVRQSVTLEKPPLGGGAAPESP